MKRENAVRKFEKKEKKISVYSQDFMIVEWLLVK